MRKLAILAGAVSLFAGANIAQAADHLFTATAAGGLTEGSQPFLNPINPTGKTTSAPAGEDVPGQGSVLSGEDTMVPATDHATGATLKTPPVVGSFTVPRGK
jgi:hypothetical protein